MEYFKFGQGEKSMVILPGLSVISVMKSAHAIEEAYAPMASDFTIYVLDRRLDMPEVYTISDMASDTVSVLSALGLSDIYLFGASQGGMIAMTIAIEAPELVSKLALGSTSAAVKADGATELPNWVELAEKKDATALYLAFGEALYPAEMFASYKDVFVPFRDPGKGYGWF